jgi:hypothetical protein
MNVFFQSNFSDATYVLSTVCGSPYGWLAIDFEPRATKAQLEGFLDSHPEIRDLEAQSPDDKATYFGKLLIHLFERKIDPHLKLEDRIQLEGHRIHVPVGSEKEVVLNLRAQKTLISYANLDQAVVEAAKKNIT